MMDQAPAQTIYLDYCATTPVDDRVLDVMLPFFSKMFGNAASQHAFGRRAELAVEGARAQVARLLNCSTKDVIWTSGATESNNLAIKGVARSFVATKKHLITQATEHKAVLDPFASLRADGFDVTILDVDCLGRIEADTLKNALNAHTALSVANGSERKRDRYTVAVSGIRSRV